MFVVDNLMTGNGRRLFHFAFQSPDFARRRKQEMSRKMATRLERLANHPISNSFQKKANNLDQISQAPYPVRIPVFVMRLAEFKAKPDANHANPHPMQDWSYRICNQYRATSPAHGSGFKSDTTRTNHARTGIIGLRSPWPRQLRRETHYSLLHQPGLTLRKKTAPSNFAPSACKFLM